MYCENCGYEIPEGKRFCARCGTAVPNNVRSTDARAQEMVRSNDGTALSQKARKQKPTAILVLVIGLIIGITLIVIGAAIQGKSYVCIGIGIFMIFLSISISGILFVFSQRYMIANYAGKTLGVALKSAARELDSDDERERN